MNYRDGDNVRQWTRIVAQVYQKCRHATMGIGDAAASLTRTRTSHFTPSYSTSNASGSGFEHHTNPTSCFARVSFESDVSKSSGFAGMAEPTSYKVADGPIAKIYSGQPRRRLHDRFRCKSDVDSCMRLYYFCDCHIASQARRGVIFLPLLLVMGDWQKIYFRDLRRFSLTSTNFFVYIPQHERETPATEAHRS